jgi:heme oxygenase (biliverdin-IX-beta and delta-forming)
LTNDAQGHGRGGNPGLVFTPPDVPAPTHAERARSLVACHKIAALASLSLDPPGYPYASFATYALEGGEPVFLISRMAEHTRNLQADSRASLLIHDSDKPDPLANGRVTLVGRVSRVERPASSARAAYLTAHPTAEYYADFADFDFYRMQVESLRYIGGYGRMSWVDADAFRSAEPDPLASASSDILAHMNQDHASALVTYARAFTDAHDASSAVMTAIDRYGFEMTVHTPRGVGPARLPFEPVLTHADQARSALIAMLRSAESKLPR